MQGFEAQRRDNEKKSCVSTIYCWCSAIVPDFLELAHHSLQEKRESGSGVQGTKCLDYQLLLTLSCSKPAEGIRRLQLVHSYLSIAVRAGLLLENSFWKDGLLKAKSGCRDFC